MRLLATLLALTALGLATTPLQAGDEAAGKHPHLTELKAKYDTNHDGKLDETERAALRADVAARIKSSHPQLFATIDKDGNGTLSDSEFKAAREQLKALRKERRTGKDATGTTTAPTR